MEFNDLLINREERFSLGQEKQSGKFYVSIPVSNGLVDYEEYYEIDGRQFELFQVDLKAALEFVKRCRSHQADDLLIMKPGKNRGIAV